MLNQGGASMQYTAVVKNLLGLKPHRKAMYLTTGLWSSLAFEEARKFVEPTNLIEVANMRTSEQMSMADPSTWHIDPEASFFHYCSNETVDGFELDEQLFPWELIPRDVAVVTDMSSNIGTRPINWDRTDVIYAGC